MPVRFCFGFSVYCKIKIPLLLLLPEKTPQKPQHQPPLIPLFSHWQAAGFSPPLQHAPHQVTPWQHAQPPFAAQHSNPHSYRNDKPGEPEQKRSELIRNKCKKEDKNEIFWGEFLNNLSPKTLGANSTCWLLRQFLFLSRRDRKQGNLESQTTS